MRKLTYKMIQGISKLVYRKPKIFLPKDFDPNVPSIFMCNHEKNYGPIVVTNYFPTKVRQWAHSELVDLEDCYQYVKEKFFINRMKMGSKLSSFMAKLTSKALVGSVSYNNPIPIYHDGKRERLTIKESVRALQEEDNVMIFSTNLNPLVVDDELNPDFDFLSGYLLVVKKLLSKMVIPDIYPVSVNKSKRTLSIGSPIRPNIQNNWKEEREKIRNYVVKHVISGYYNPDRLGEV